MTVYRWGVRVTKVVQCGSLVQTCVEALATQRSLWALPNRNCLLRLILLTVSWRDITNRCNVTHFLWVKLWAGCNCLCLELLTQQLLSHRKCSFSGWWLLLWPENKNWKANVLFVLSFLYSWLAYAGHFLQMSALYLDLFIFYHFSTSCSSFTIWNNYLEMGVCVRDCREIAVHSTGFLSPIVFSLWGENRRTMAKAFLNSSCAKFPIRSWTLCNLCFLVYSLLYLLEPFVMWKT